MAKNSNVICKWGSKKWVTTSKKALAINDDLGIDYAWSTDDKKLDSQKISFSYDIMAELGVNIRKEILSWKKLVGKYKPLYVGGKLFGPKNMRLMSASASGIKTIHGGRMRAATISLSFEQKVASKSSKKKNLKGKSNVKKTAKKTTKKKKTKK